MAEQATVNDTNQVWYVWETTPYSHPFHKVRSFTVNPQTAVTVCGISYPFPTRQVAFTQSLTCTESNKCQECMQ